MPMSGRSPRARATLRPVSSEDEQELEDRWLLGLRGRSVESVDVYEFSVGVAFGGGFALTIESPANLHPAPRAPKVPALTLNSDGTVSGSDALLLVSVSCRVLGSKQVPCVSCSRVARIYWCRSTSTMQRGNSLALRGEGGSRCREVASLPFPGSPRNARSSA
jgi:hypothetical protein